MKKNSFSKLDFHKQIYNQLEQITPPHKQSQRRQYLTISDTASAGVNIYIKVENVNTIVISYLLLS